MERGSSSAVPTWRRAHIQLIAFDTVKTNTAIAAEMTKKIETFAIAIHEPNPNEYKRPHAHKHN